MKNSVIDAGIVSPSFFALLVNASYIIFVFKQSLQRHSAISFSVAYMMKNGFSDKILPIETLISFLRSLSCNYLIVAVRIILFAIYCMLPVLLALFSILIFSSVKPLYNLRYCSLVILTVFLAFLPSVWNSLYFLSKFSFLII